MKYQELDENGRPKPHPIDEAIGAHVVRALCPETPASGINHSRLTKSLRFDQLSH
jgi:D-alanyl-D-alanine carboxypeptidase